MAHAPQTSSGGAAGVAALVGTWRLAEYSNWDSSGSLVRAFGPNPIGYIFLDQTGHFSVHIMRTPPVPPFAAGPENPTPSEAHEPLQSYYGAFGTYDVYGLGPQLVRRALRLIREHEDEISSSMASLTATLEPVVGSAAAFLILGEVLGAPRISGGLAIAAAVVLIQVADLRTPDAAVPPAPG